MIILFYLSSGLFLGWSLGANDASNIFGTAVGSRMVKFRTAAIIASIFVILGAVVQGAGASHTLGKLGNVSTLAAAFTVALSAALTVYWMTRLKLPVSTSQSIVGSIIGWNFYTNNPTDLHTLTKIVTTWVSGPILGGIFAILLYMLVKLIMRKSRVHLLYVDAYIRYGLIIVGAFGAYSLGANNIANVMGVFTNAIHLPTIDLFIVQIESTQQLFFIGSLAIAIGIITYSKRVMETVGNTLMPLSPEAAIVVVLSQAMVLFIFSSQGLSDAFVSIGLPPIPLVPVSSSQIVIGSIIGIGLYKGGKEIKYNILGSISLGWVATPILSGLLAFFLLFFVNNVFQKDVGGTPIGLERIKNNLSTKQETSSLDSLKTAQYVDSVAVQGKESQKDTVVVKNVQNQENLSAYDDSHTFAYWTTIVMLLIGAIVLLFYLYAVREKLKDKEIDIKSLDRKYRRKVSLLEQNVQETINKQQDLDKELKFRQSEMVTMAMSIIQKNEFLNDLKKEIIQSKSSVREPEHRLVFNRLSLMITQNLSIDRDREKFQMFINQQHSNFLHRLSESFSGITENEKRLAALLRLNLSSKEIASILNISPKSVEMNRYRLRKKLRVSSKINLSEFIREF